MSDAFNLDTMWLSIVNVGLGVAVLVCLLLVGRNVVRETLRRIAHRIHGPARDRDRGLDLESLGITMSDGGAPINEMSSKHKPPEPEDPPNIIRSEN